MQYEDLLTVIDLINLLWFKVLVITGSPKAHAINMILFVQISALAYRLSLSKQGYLCASMILKLLATKQAENCQSFSKRPLLSNMAEML